MSQFLRLALAVLKCNLLISVKKPREFILMGHIKIIIVALSHVVRAEERENCIKRRGFYTVT
jgi:hypothetical protein